MVVPFCVSTFSPIKDSKMKDPIALDLFNPLNWPPIFTAIAEMSRVTGLDMEVLIAQVLAVYKTREINMELVNEILDEEYALQEQLKSEQQAAKVTFMVAPDETIH
jgi:hypothetical protein